MNHHPLNHHPFNDPAVNEAKICPKCGAPQQWKMWRYCGCGHDFGSTIPVIVKAWAPQEPQPEIHLTFDRVHRWVWWLCLIAIIIFFLTKPFHALDWLRSAAIYGCLGLFFLPLPRKPRTPKNPVSD